jgi:cellulose biosynthesis protein BcsQ
MKQGACRQKYLLIDLDTEGNASSWLKENLGALWQDFSKCFSNAFYRSPAKPLTKKRLPS